jgi:Domain of unknown function (DUF4157)
LNAQAFTVGNDIYFNSGKYAPESDSGRHLLAHELTHTVQQGGRVDRKIQRFEASERDQISDIDGVIEEATTFANNAYMLGGFVEQAGGQSASAVLRGALGADVSNNPAMHNRYLISCRCGMIDMRHFYQLMYLAFTFWNSRATQMGRNHELEAEATSRFAAEDTTSNALGAYFGANNINSGYTSVSTFISRLRSFLNRCSPVAFASLPTTEQNNIVSFYSQRNSAGIPANQNESAVPFILSISSCNSTNRSFPFVVDNSDPNRNTISSQAFNNGVASLSTDSDIRDFVNTQRSEIIRNLSTAEKVTIVGRLLSGWISDEDVDAAIVICRNAQDSRQLNTMHRQLESFVEGMNSENQKNRMHRALSGN